VGWVQWLAGSTKNEKEIEKLAGLHGFNRLKATLGCKGKIGIIFEFLLWLEPKV
jgi:hypothetical protein